MPMLPVAILDVGGVRFPVVRGDLHRLLLDRLDREHQRRAADCRPARAVGAEAVLHFVGIAVNDGDLFDRNAQARRR